MGREGLGVRVGASFQSFKDLQIRHFTISRCASAQELQLPATFGQFKDDRTGRDLRYVAKLCGVITSGEEGRERGAFLLRVISGGCLQ